MDMQVQRITSCSDYDVLRAGNDDILETCNSDLHQLTSLLARIFKPEADYKAHHDPPFDFVNTMLVRDCYKGLLQVLATQNQKLLARYAVIVSFAESSKVSICYGLGLLLKDF